MPRITVTLEDEQAALLEEKTGEGGPYDSKSEAVRSFITEYERLSERVDDLERENERLRSEKRLILEQREENTELARYVEDELSYREAGLGTRMKWWLFGKRED